DPPQATEPELDANGVPVQNRPPDASIYLRALAGLICGIVPVVLAFTHWTHKPPVYQVVLGMVCVGLATFLPFTFMNRLEKEKKPVQAGWIAVAGIMVAGMLIGGLGLIVLWKAARLPGWDQRGGPYF